MLIIRDSQTSTFRSSSHSYLFSFLFSNNEIEETYFIYTPVFCSRIDFPGSQGVLYGGDVRLPDYLRSSQRVCVRFFGAAASLREAFACATVHVKD